MSFAVVAGSSNGLSLLVFGVNEQPLDGVGKGSKVMRHT
jgi:hypothetical protein